MANTKNNKSKGKNNRRMNGNRNPGSNSQRRFRERDDLHSGDAANRPEREGNTPHNSPEWYSAYPALVSAAANLSFANPLGSTFTLADKMSDPGSAAQHQTAVPGIMILDCMDVPGVSRSQDSVVNNLAHQLYTTVRYANSGAANYDSSDLMLYTLAADSLFTIWAHAVRAYSVLQTYSYSNRYLAESLTEALGFNYQSFFSNMARFWGQINALAVRIGSVCIPADMSYLKRHIWMYSNIFADSASTKAQLYAYKPKYAWVYDEFSNENGGQLKAQDISYFASVDQFVTLTNEMIGELVTSQSLMLMAGDIKKAYGVEGLQKITEIPQTMVASFTYDPRTCMEIQNATVIKAPTADNIIKADAATNTVLYNPLFAFPVTAGTPTVPVTQAYALNVRDIEVPSTDDVMKATRLMVFLEPIEVDGADDPMYQIASCGTEVCVGGRMYYFTRKTETSALTLSSQSFSSHCPKTFATVELLCCLEKFDWHPFMYITSSTASGLTICHGIAGDLDNYTLITETGLSKMHEAALYSELFNPAMGTFVRK